MCASDRLNGSAVGWIGVLLAVVAGSVPQAAFAQARPAASPMAAPAAAAPAASVPEASLVPQGDRAAYLRQVASEIAYLRQEQALLEAKTAVAKAKADLASAGRAPAAPAPVPSLPASAAAPLPRVVFPQAPTALYLLGVGGTPGHRQASVAVGSGPAQQVEAGGSVGGWRVRDVGLAEVSLESDSSGKAVLRMDAPVPVASAKAASPATAAKAASGRASRARR
jgi:type IV pilus biogenesis protein PilP